MLEYIASIMDAGGHVPNFGDADDAIIARLDPDVDVDVYRSLLATGAVLFDARHSNSKPAEFDDKTRWLLGDAPRSASLPNPSTCRRVSLPMRRDFPRSGYYVLGDRFETQREVRIVADAGPTGIFVDRRARPCGCVVIHVERRGRGAADRSRARTRITHSDSGAIISRARRRTTRCASRRRPVHQRRQFSVAEACAGASDRVRARRCSTLGREPRWLRRLAPVTHRREILFDHATSALTVVDEIFCRESHAVEMFWHFAEACEVTLEGDRATARSGGAHLTMQLPQGTRRELVRGREAAPLGWVSRRFDQRTPSPTLLVQGMIRGNARLVTRIELSISTARTGMRAHRPVSNRGSLHEQRAETERL